MPSQRCRCAAAASPARKPLPAGPLASLQSPPPKRGLTASPFAGSAAPSTPRTGATACSIAPDLLDILRSTPGRPSSCGRSIGSTSAGPTPRRPDGAGRSPRSVDEESACDWFPEAQGSCAQTSLGAEEANASGPKWGTRQSRKIFVGGIPQELGREQLCTIFSGCGVVERAWLQRHRRDLRRNHRGFGFVLFKDEAAVDAVLGSDFSRFFYLPDGSRLELKRALDSTEEMLGPSPEREPAGQPGLLQTPPAAPQPPSPPVATYAEVRSIPSSWVAGGCGVPVTSQAVVAPAPQWVYAPQTVVMVPAASPAATGAPAMAASTPLASDDACRQALAAMLIQAMPDHYED